MLALNPGTRYFLFAGITDFRKSYDGLSGIVINQMGQSLQTGDYFIFLNRHRNQVRILSFEGDGLALYSKRLEAGTYEVPTGEEKSGSIRIKSEVLNLMLQGVVLRSVRYRKRWGKAENNRK